MPDGVLFKLFLLSSVGKKNRLIENNVVSRYAIINQTILASGSWKVHRYFLRRGNS
jgi:hypothetical protein